MSHTNLLQIANLFIYTSAVSVLSLQQCIHLHIETHTDYSRKNSPNTYLKLDNRPLVVVRIRVLRRRENSNHLGEVTVTVTVTRTLPIVHPVTLVLHLMRADHAHQIIITQKLRSRLNPENIRTVSIMVKLELPRHTPVLRLNRVSPQYITKQTILRNLMESVNTIQISQCLQLRRYTSVHCQEFTVHHAAQRQKIEQVAKRVKHLLVVLQQDLLPERETYGHLTALVVTTKHHD